MRKNFREFIVVSIIIGMFFIIGVWNFTSVFKDIYENKDLTILTVSLGILFIPMLYYIFCDITRTVSRLAGNSSNIIIIWFGIITTVIAIVLLAITIFAIVYNIFVKIGNSDNIDIILRTFYEYRYLSIILAIFAVLSRLSLAFVMDLEKR